MKNEALRFFSILVCFFVIASCSHEKQFTQKKYDKLQKVAVNSDGTNYNKSNKTEGTIEEVIVTETKNPVTDKTGDVLSYIPKNKTNISTPYEETLIPFILKKVTKKLSAPNFTDVKKQNCNQQSAKKQDKKTAPRGGRGHVFWNIAIATIVVAGIVIAAILIAKSS
ncbi:MAG: hypothetical protein PHD97_11515 [Bacteroidales bacterium]|nr:hypothetical protein [Bacteroidales bacterium]